MADTDKDLPRNPTADPATTDVTTAPPAHVPGAPGHSPAHHDGEGHGAVRFEVSDVKAGSVFVAGLMIGGVVLAAALGLIGFYSLLLSQNRPGKVTDLPVAAGDYHDNPGRMPPEPRLEIIDDVRQPGDNRFQFLPRRAENYLAKQEGVLEKGGLNQTPIQEAIEQAAGHLPARKDSPPPAFSRRLPSKASSGRVETGGQ